MPSVARRDVDPAGVPPARTVRDLCAFLTGHRDAFVLTGAGISTDSGIPAHRSADGNWARSAPILWHDFLHDPGARRRYWARSMIGYPSISRAQPNVAHRALASLQRAGYVASLVTQNVDGLHQRAGSREVIELHGSLREVVCMTCGVRYDRGVLQRMLETENPALLSARAAALADGDSAVEPHADETFRVPVCDGCGGTLKPDVVFFGDSVPTMRVGAAASALAHSSAVLVLGSSLAVYSGFRYCALAREAGKPIAAVNLGRTRADALLAFKVEANCGWALRRVCEELALEPA